jgi:hypothetical protein
LRIKRTSDGKYWNGSGWQVVEVWVYAVGTTDWSYIFSPQSWVEYEVSSMAVDKAGNYETTYDTKTFMVAGPGAAGYAPEGAHSRPPLCTASVLDYLNRAGFWILILIFAIVVTRGLAKRRR